MATAAAGLHPERLRALDAALWGLESAIAPMHVGWAVALEPPAVGPPPTFAQLRAHVDGRLGRAPRFRQRIAAGRDGPRWVDDDRFDIAHHVRRSSATELGTLADAVLSVPLAPHRPLWELWIGDHLSNGRIGIVGKAHHGLVDGLAAVAFMALLLDDDAPPEHSTVPPRPPRTPGRPRAGRRAHVLATNALPLAPPSPLNGALSRGRRLACAARPLEDLERVSRAFGTTINDVVLAASAGGLRRLLFALGGPVRRLKAMVPVSVRAADERWGNRVVAVYPWLPCDEPDGVRRLLAVHAAMRRQKWAGAPVAAETILMAIGHAPRPVRAAAARALSSPRLFNLTVTNVPAPPGRLSLMGCVVTRAYPVVPLAAGHRFSIGMTSVNGVACFGVFADGARAAKADLLAGHIGAAIDELTARANGADRVRTARPATLTT